VSFALWDASWQRQKELKRTRVINVLMIRFKVSQKGLKVNVESKQGLSRPEKGTAALPFIALQPFHPAVPPPLNQNRYCDKFGLAFGWRFPSDWGRESSGFAGAV
jgi:hypothetical protein